jgi:hypothetical protein
MTLASATALVLGYGFAIISAGAVMDPLAGAGNISSTASVPILIPACGQCSFDLQFKKEKTEEAPPCSTVGSENYYFGYCKRYECQHGYYYQFTGWSPNDCANHIEPTNPICPLGSCIP